MSRSFVSVYWSSDAQKPMTSNILIDNSYEFDNVILSLTKIISLNNYDSVINKNWFNNNKKINTNSNIIIGSSNNISNNQLMGNLLIDGNIYPLFNNLGSNNNRWKYLYANSISLNDIPIKTLNSSNYISIPAKISASNLNINSLIFTLSNNQLFFESNGISIKSIEFSNFKSIIYSNNLYATSNVIINNLIYKLNHLFTTDTIPLGIHNKFITNGILNSNITFTENLNVLQSYKINGFTVPFEINNHSNIFFNGDIKGSNIIDLNYENEFTINQTLEPLKLALTTTSNTNIHYKNKKNTNWNHANSNIIINNRLVGIGTTNPNVSLDVNGDINFTQNLKINNFIFPFSIYSNTNIIASNSSLNYINDNFAYYPFWTNGSIRFPQPTNCDILVIGAGGNGGEGFFGGGGGAGEVVYYPSYPFLANNYDIQIGQSSFDSNLRTSQILLNKTSIIIKANGGGNGGYLSNNPESGGCGGGGYGGSNSSNGGLIGIKWSSIYSYSSNGTNGTSNIIGGNGGSVSFVSSITGINQTFAIGGIGATSNSIPSLKTSFGSGGDGNGGLGTPGIVIIKVPLTIQKACFDGYINYSNIDNKPVINELISSANYLNIGNYNQINFPLGNVSWNNEWFIYIGKSPSSIQNSFIFSHLSSNINSKWWFNGSQNSTNAEISDMRIKKEISEIHNPLDKLMLLKPKEYYLCDDKDYLKKYGIIAQDVNCNPALNHLVYTDIDYIANVYSYGSYMNRIIICDDSIINKIEIGDELKILLDNLDASEIIIEESPYYNRYKKRFAKVKRVIDDYSFEVFDDIELSTGEKIFIYGKKMNDFKKLDYSSLYSLNIRCMQELILKVRNNGKKLDDLEKRLNII